MGSFCRLGGRIEQQFFQRFLACFQLLQRRCVAGGQLFQWLGVARFGQQQLFGRMARFRLFQLQRLGRLGVR